MKNLTEPQISQVLSTAYDAGKTILDIYASPDFEVEIKSNKSPLTKADKASHDIIENGLRLISDNDIPILSEEGKEIAYSTRRGWHEYWLIDPLDGTKEFIKRNGEFTVNIALIRENTPVFGVVYAPVLDLCYYGGLDLGSWKIENQKKEKILSEPVESDVLTVVASRSHMTDETRDYIEGLRAVFPVIETKSSGSSLKLCMVADGQADVYPRLAPTMEWDTAAADAVCRAAGCRVVQYENDEHLLYNKENLLNPWFIVKGQRI